MNEKLRPSHTVYTAQQHGPLYPYFTIIILSMPFGGGGGEGEWLGGGGGEGCVCVWGGVECFSISSDQNIVSGM